MKTTAERRGRPDRSRTGNYRSEGDASGCCPDRTNPRRGYPDRTNTGTNRHLDVRRETHNRLRTQVGVNFTRIQLPIGDTDNRPSTPVAGDVGLNTSFDSRTSLEWYDEANTRTVNLRSPAQHNGAVNIGLYDTAGNFTADEVEGALAELFTGLPTAPVEQSFTATTKFSYTHSFGVQPSVSVKNSAGFEIGVCIYHDSVNAVTIFFNGTITNGVLLIN